MYPENTRMPFAITYRSHWCGPCLQYEDTKEETTIYSDGKVVTKRFDHHGAKGRFRVIERSVAYASPEDVENIYAQLMDIVQNHEGIELIVDDTAREIVLAEPGLKISIDGGLFNGERYAESIVAGFLATVDFEWESVSH